MAAGSTTSTATGLADAWSATARQLHEFVVRRVEDPDVAVDITQDVFVRAQRAAPDLAGIRNVPAWLHRIARNAIIDHYRTRRPHEPLPDDYRDEAVDRPDDTAPNRATRELARCLGPLVDQLPAKYREAVTLVDLDGRTHAAAARVAGLSTSGMKSRVQRGRRQLRDILTACCAVATDDTGAITGYTPHAHEGCDC